jgi:hypothetical protein
MLGELFCQLGTQMLQKIQDPKNEDGTVMLNVAVLNKLVRHPQLHIDVKLKPEFCNLIYFNI